MDVDVDSLERATLAAVPPQRVLELDGWLVGLDDGTVGRAHSAVPLRHRDVDAAAVDRLEQAFAAAGRAPVYRIPLLPAFDAVRAALARTGAAAAKPTLTMTGSLAGLAALPASASGPEVRLLAEPDAAWSALFLGEGFDPVDAASRIGILRRSPRSVYAAAMVDGGVAAVGSACSAFGWCGIHGMRTAPAFRGRGLASAILATLARHALAQGVDRAFLQVEQANAAAQRLYRRGGLTSAWCYAYWGRA